MIDETTNERCAPGGPDTLCGVPEVAPTDAPRSAGSGGVPRLCSERGGLDEKNAARLRGVANLEGEAVARLEDGTTGDDGHRSGDSDDPEATGGVLNVLDQGADYAVTAYRQGDGETLVIDTEGRIGPLTVVYWHGHRSSPREEVSGGVLSDVVDWTRRTGIGLRVVVPQATDDGRDWSHLGPVVDWLTDSTVGPVVAVAHSGGFAPLRELVTGPRGRELVRAVVLLDAAYGAPDWIEYVVRAWPTVILARPGTDTARTAATAIQAAGAPTTTFARALDLEHAAFRRGIPLALRILTGRP